MAASCRRTRADRHVPGAGGELLRHRAPPRAAHARRPRESAARAARAARARRSGSATTRSGRALRGLQLRDRRCAPRRPPHPTRRACGYTQPARGGERDAPRGALEHAHAERLLEVRDRAADRRLGHAERPRGGREPIEIHDLREHGQLSGRPDQVHGSLNPHLGGSILFHQRGRRARPWGLESAPQPTSRQGQAMKISDARLLGRALQQHARQSLLDPGEGRQQRRAAQDRAGGAARRAPRAGHAAAHAAGADRLRHRQELASRGSPAQEPPRFEDNETTIEQLRARSRARSIA